MCVYCRIVHNDANGKRDWDTHRTLANPRLVNTARTEHYLHSMALKIGPTGGVIITHAYDSCLDSAMLSKGCTQEQLNSTRRAVKLPKKQPGDLQMYSYERHSAGGNDKSQNRRSGLLLADGSFYNGRYQEGLTLDPHWLEKVKVGVKMRTLNASSATRPSPTRPLRIWPRSADRPHLRTAART